MKLLPILQLDVNNNFIINYGRVVDQKVTHGYQVFFPQSFSSTNYSVQVTCNNKNLKLRATTGTVSDESSNMTKSSVTIFMYHDQDTSTLMTMYWTAIGY